MKKTMGLLLSLCLLTGCASTPPANSSGSAEAVPSVPPSSTVETPTADVRYTLETEVLEDSVQAEDGTTLYSYRFELPRLTIQGADGGAETEDAVTQAFNAAFDAWRSGEAYEDTLAAAREDYDWRTREGMLEENSWMEYADGFTYTAYQTDRLISVEGEGYTNSGGAHPNTGYSAWNFDVKEGRFVPTDMLGKDETFLQTVTTEILRQMTEKAAQADVPVGDLFWTDYEKIVALWTNYAVSFNEDGMRVTFSPYDLAAYAAGPQVFVIPKELIQPYLSQYGQELLQLSSTDAN